MEKIYRILLGIFLVCLIPILLVLSYWSCRYSYYGTVDYSIRNLLIKDSTWKHFVIFLLTSVLVYEGDKWLNAQNQEKQEKICRYTLLATGMTTFILGCVYVLKNPYYPEEIRSMQRRLRRIVGRVILSCRTRRLCRDVSTAKRVGNIV